MVNIVQLVFMVWAFVLFVLLFVAVIEKIQFLKLLLLKINNFLYSILRIHLYLFNIVPNLFIPINLALYNPALLKPISPILPPFLLQIPKQPRIFILLAIQHIIQFLTFLKQILYIFINVINNCKYFVIIFYI